MSEIEPNLIEEQLKLLNTNKATTATQTFAEEICEANNSYQDYFKNLNGCSFTLSEIEPNLIKEQLKLLNTNKASDIFGVFSKVLQLAAKNIVEPLTYKMVNR